MNIAEILRKLADVVDGAEGSDRPTNSVPHAELEPVQVDTSDNTETTVVIPPLQAKLELMKKSMGMDSAYDEQEDCGCDDVEVDEVELMKRMAGIQEASDDEPLDN